MRQKGVLQISNPTANVTFSISGLAVYSITPTLTNCTAQAGNPTTIEQGGTAQLTFLFDGTNYKCPTTAPTVTGATGTWVKVSDTKGNLTLSNPSGAVSFSVVGEEVQSGYTLNVNWTSSVYNYNPSIDYTLADGTSGRYYFETESGSTAIENVTSVDSKNIGGFGTATPDIPFTLTDHTALAINIYYCFVEGTPITTADGSTIPVEMIELGMRVLTFDFNTGHPSVGEITWVMKPMTATRYWKITLSDGTIMKLIGQSYGSHRLYNVTKQSFMYPQDFEANDYAMKQDGSLVTVVSCEVVEETVRYYNIASEHINVYANGVLTSNRLNNKYRIENNKFTDELLMSAEDESAYLKHLEDIKA